MLLLAYITTLLTAPVLAQFVAAPKDLKKVTGAAGIDVRYKEVPNGICETHAKVRSYTGYADVAENEHIFFWFFEARDVDPMTAPLTVWINGGPGSSSMIGLFQELGPCGVDIHGKVYNNPFSFSKVSNMLFIDQPVTVGLSYTIPVPGYIGSISQTTIQLPGDECPPYAAKTGTCGTYSVPDQKYEPNTTAGAAPNMWKTLQGFMGAFPQYARDGFHFTTESYGGHYGPIFNEYFEEQNAAKIPGAMNINLKSVLIGNGWYDPLIQYQAYYNFTVSPGNTYDYKPFNQMQENKMYNSLYGPGNCVDQSKECYAIGADDICSASDNFCADEVEELLDVIANRDEYDIRELMPDRFPYEFYVDYLNLPRIQAAIGAYQNFSEYSPIVGANYETTGDDDREDGTIAAVAKLLSQGITVIMYAGDADYNCNWLGGEVVSNEVGAPGFSSAGYVDIQTSDNVVHGQVRQSGTFAFVRIYESGHEVPFYQPLTALQMFERVISGKDIETGKVKVTPKYKTFGSKKSTFREGIKTVQMHVLPKDATYNTTTGAPNPIPPGKRSVERSVASTARAAARKAVEKKAKRASFMRQARKAKK